MTVKQEVLITFKADPDFKGQLIKAAAIEERSLSALIRFALKSYIGKYSEKELDSSPGPASK